MHISIIMQQVTFFMAYSSLLRNAFIIPFCFPLSRGECIKNSQETVRVSNIGYTQSAARKSREGWRFAKQIRPDLD